MLHWYWVWISNTWYHKRLSLKLISRESSLSLCNFSSKAKHCFELVRTTRIYSLHCQFHTKRMISKNCEPADHPYNAYGTRKEFWQFPKLIFRIIKQFSPEPGLHVTLTFEWILFLTLLFLITSAVTVKVRSENTRTQSVTFSEQYESVRLWVQNLIYTLCRRNCCIDVDSIHWTACGTNST